MTTLTDGERIAVTLALTIIFALGILFLMRLTDAERRLANAERRLTDAERQSLPDTKREPIRFLRFKPA
jgi:hypothetical protein